MESIEDWVRKATGDKRGVYDSYNRLGEIARTAGSVVTLVEKKGRRYAMKEPADGLADTSESTLGAVPRPTMFEDEALRWSHITVMAPEATVGLLDFNVDPHPWMVMELADCSLEKAMQEGSVNIGTVVDLLCTLQKIHDIGIIHRDIKPGNILLVGGRWKFSDFGISKEIGAVTDGRPKGTAEYMAPEQIQPREFGEVDFRTDIWQMGILAYKILVGRTPYPGTDGSSIGFRICLNGPDMDAVPERYRAVLSKALSMDRSERYRTAREFANALESATCNTVGDNLGDGLKKGLALYTGVGGRYDPSSALELFSAGEGLSRAIAGYMHFIGQGTRTDEELGLVMIAEAKDDIRRELGRGNPVAEWLYGAIHDFGIGTERSGEIALKYYRKSAEKSFIPAMLALGDLYFEGELTEYSEEEAVSWYRKAANLGSAVAECNMGDMFYGGSGVEESWTEAVRWYRRAADHGNTYAQRVLGEMYMNGEGAPQSYEEAEFWCRKAAESGDRSSQFRLGRMYEEGLGMEQSYPEAAKWLERAAENGDATSQTLLGLYYEEGMGVPKDIGKAMRLYAAASGQGMREAQENLERLQNGHTAS